MVYITITSPKATSPALRRALVEKGGMASFALLKQKAYRPKLNSSVSMDIMNTAIDITSGSPYRLCSSSYPPSATVAASQSTSYASSRNISRWCGRGFIPSCGRSLSGGGASSPSSSRRLFRTAQAVMAMKPAIARAETAAGA